MNKAFIVLAAASALAVAGWAALEARGAADCAACTVAAAAAPKAETCNLCGEAKGSEACQQAEQAAKELTALGIGFLSPEALHKKVKSGAPPVVVDVLPASSYRRQHVKGAINIQLTEIAELAPRVLPDKTAEIVVYCGSYRCSASVQAAKALKELGYTNVHDFKGGIRLWAARGLPIGGTGE